MDSRSSPKRYGSKAKPQALSPVVKSQGTHPTSGIAQDHPLCPATDGRGQAEGAIGASRDVTEHDESAQDAERLASLGMIGATLAHELAQPLSTAQLALQSAAAELERLDCPDVVRQDLQAGLTACSRISEMVRRFRDLARPPGKTRETEVNIPLVAERTFRLLGQSARQAKVAFRTENLEALPALRMGENELDQLFFALVQNAIQAADGRKDRHLLIKGTLQGDLILLQFQDTCGGIEPVHLPRIFEPFFTTKPPGQGTGLGLCIARRIACRRGGQIAVENRPGEGATFSVTLPQVPRPALGG